MMRLGKAGKPIETKAIFDPLPRVLHRRPAAAGRLRFYGSEFSGMTVLAPHSVTKAQKRVAGAIEVMAVDSVAALVLGVEELIKLAPDYGEPAHPDDPPMLTATFRQTRAKSYQGR